MAKHTDKKACPLCGRHNRCAVEAGRPPASCWCQAVEIDPAALAAIPADEQGLRCICPGCAQPERGVDIAR